MKKACDAVQTALLLLISTAADHMAKISVSTYHPVFGSAKSYHHHIFVTNEDRRKEEEAVCLKYPCFMQTVIQIAGQLWLRLKPFFFQGRSQGLQGVHMDGEHQAHSFSFVNCSVQLPSAPCRSPSCTRARCTRAEAVNLRVFIHTCKD